MPFGLDTGGGAISPNQTDNGHMSTGDTNFGAYTVTHAPVNIGGSTVNGNKWLYAVAAIAGLFLYFKSKGRK